MSRALRVLLSSSLLGVPLAASEVPAAVPEALRPLAPLVGTEWVGAFPSGEIRDEQSFAWVYDGRFLRNEHRVVDAAGEAVYEGETIYAWDPLEERIVWWYWNTTGGHVVGTLTPTAEGFLAEGTNHGPAGQTPRVRGVLRAITATSWESVQLHERDGEWVEQWTMVFRPRTEPDASEPAGELFIAHYTTGPAWDAAKPFAEQRHAGEHSAHLRALREAGTIVLGARYGDVGMVVLRAASEAAARDAVARDPAVAAGLFTVTVDAFSPFMGGCVSR